ncbi:MAG: RING finger protein [Ruminococcus bromii]|nr:RING finger protein [Ruminococcus bromii]
MEFTNYKCPVCNEHFKQGDDIVVCPDCGAPHHRKCYEELGHCYYKDEHSKDFSFEELNKDEDENDNADKEKSTVVCPRCHHVNDSTSFYCGKCGFPLSEDTKQESQNPYQNQGNPQQPFGQGTPFGYAGAGMPAFDPLAGLDSEQEIADNVTVGEMSKFVGKSTQYFLLIFNKIKNFGTSRFNFAAFLFSGVYFLYRKMIALGIIFSLLSVSFTVGEFFIMLMPEYQNYMNTIINSASSSQMFYTMSLGSQYSMSEILFIYSPYILSALNGILMIVCGFIANRTYYKHCTKKINAIKKESVDVNINKKLEASGGVNLPLALCVEIAFLVLNYIPLFL